MFYNFILLILASFTAGFSTRQLYVGDYMTRTAANIYLLGLMLGWSGVLIAILKIFNVQ